VDAQKAAALSVLRRKLSLNAAVSGSRESDAIS
jgi:hypothetical protein